MTVDAVRIRRVDGSDTDLGTVVAVTNATRPEWSTTVEELRWSDATYPGTVRFVAEDGDAQGGDRAVGVATVGRIWVHAPGYDALWGTVDVVEPARRRGIGSRLLGAIAGVAAETGKSHLHVPAREDRLDAVGFLGKRGFTVFSRSRSVELRLDGLPRPAVRPPDGIRVTTLAAEPGLVGGVHAVALDAFRDIPGGDEPMAVGDLAEFRARDVDRPGMPADAFVIAVDEASGEVVGYASLLFLGPTPGVGFHDMTAVRREWRGRGVATTLKLATIAWAVDHGIDALATENDEANAAMRAVNRRLGYAPRPDELTMRGSVGAAMMSG
ncbi:MAG TPA: GNAT family N-acetyltransferase [Candidatus Limnocylindrales bacterium]